MSESPALIYLEADDEITAVVRRIRQADAVRVIIVAPGRSRATSSAIALRLLAREDRDVAVVGDALTRSLAAEAGVPAFATVDEARRAETRPSQADSGPRHAAIHVVRGSATDDTAPTLAATADTAETRQVILGGSRPIRRMARPRRVRRAMPVVLLGAAGLLVLGAGVAGAIMLPAATITVSPLTAAVGPESYQVEVDDPERLSGTVEATTTVTATGTYPILEPATGTVILLNWDNAPIDAPAGTLVAAGEQAFETTTAVTVPAGELTAERTIQAGEMSVGVTASQAGPAANVAAQAIDTVLSQGTAAQLRGFPNNPQPLVTNPEATSGGIDTAGPEFTQGDLDTAIASLRADLDRQVTEALDVAEGAILVRGESSEAVLVGTNDVVGNRNQASVEINGTLAWDAFSIPEARIEDAARELLEADSDVLAPGHELLPDATTVAIGAGTTLEGEIVVEVQVSARSATTPERDEVIELVAGRPREEALAALDGLGDATIDLWPGWAASVPELEWRIDVRISSGP